MLFELGQWSGLDTHQRVGRLLHGIGAGEQGVRASSKAARLSALAMRGLMLTAMPKQTRVGREADQIRRRGRCRQERLDRWPHLCQTTMRL